MNTPKDLLYTKTHEWIRFTSDTQAQIGLSDYAQSTMGDLVFVNLPAVDDEASAEAVICDVESVKAVSDVYSPLSGVVSAVNEALADAPQMINEAPYEAWIFELSNINEKPSLLTPEEYEAFVAEEEGK